MRLGLKGPGDGGWGRRGRLHGALKSANDEGVYERSGRA